MDVELIGLAADAGAEPRLRYSVRRERLQGGDHPDRLARSMCPDGIEVLHSTSWRQDRSGVTVVTYVAAPVEAEDAGHVLTAPSIVASGDPLVPSPPELAPEHVAAHAVRHLAYLATRDPGVRAAAATSRSPLFWALVRESAELPTMTPTPAVTGSGSVTTSAAPFPTLRCRRPIRATYQPVGQAL